MFSTPALGAHCAPASAAEFAAQHDLGNRTFVPLTAADALAGRPNLQPVPSTMPRAHWGATRACGPPRASLPEPKEYRNTRTRHEFTSLAALGTALGPEPLTSWCAIVSGHQDRTFLVLGSPASRSWRALRPQMFKSMKLPNAASQALGPLETARRATPAAGHHCLVPVRGCPRPDYPQAPPAAAQARPPG